MKKSIVLLLCAAAVSHAAVVKFNLSPAGSDAAVGLSPLNQVPAVTNSTGSGGTVSGGISFDTATATLTFAVGYGSSAGFSDLTGLPTSMHIHSPAPAGQTAGVLFNLAPFHFPYSNPTNGGLILGAVIYSTNDVAALLGGSNYVNIHTALNPGGEIRGQLIPLANAAPTVSCPPSATVECGPAANVTVVVSDPEGDALTVVWSVNGVAVKTNAVAAGTPGAAANVSYSAHLPLGTNVVAVTVTDDSGAASSCSTTIVIVDTIPPVISGASANPNVLWPPNHKMIHIRVRAVVNDDCGPTTWRILSVTCNQPINGLGDGNTSPDWNITGDHTVDLRAERTGTSSADRIYTLTLQAEDAAGNLSATKTVTVRVPKSQGGGRK